MHRRAEKSIWSRDNSMNGAKWNEKGQMFGEHCFVLHTITAEFLACDRCSRNTCGMLKAAEKDTCRAKDFDFILKS